MRLLSRRQAVAISLSSSIFTLACAGGRPFTPPPHNASANRPFSYEHKIEAFRVSNGLTVAAIPDDKTNLVQVDMRYQVGSAEDPEGKRGLAHLVEHILFEVKSSSDHPTLTARLQDQALFHNAWTNWDATHYTSTGSSEVLSNLLEVEADRMAASCDDVSEALLVREREIVRQEIAWRGAGKETLRDVLRRDFFNSAHPYHEEVGGSDQSVAGLTRKDVCDFIESYYAPSRAILVVSGAIEPDSLQALAGPIFGPITKAPAKQRRPVEAVHFTGGSSHHKVDIEESSVAISFPYPAWGSADYFKADLLTDMLAEHLDALEGKKHLKSVAVGVVGGVRSRAIVFVLTPDDLQHRESLVPLFFKQRDALLESVSQRAFAFRRAYKRTGIVRSLESYSALAGSVADYLQYTEHYLFMLKRMTDLATFTLPMLARYHAGNLLKTQSHITYLDPLQTEDQSESSRPVLEEPSQEMDIASWRAPVDLKEANGPLSIRANPVVTPMESFELSNGMRVVLAPNFDYPTLDIRVVFPIGDSMDPPSLPGLAYWTSQLIETELNDEWRAELWNRVIEVKRMGGITSAWTTSRSTVFRNTGLAMYADGLLWQLHWLLESGETGKALKRSKKALRKLRKEAKAKGDKRSDDETDSRYIRFLRAALFGAQHPYSVERDTSDAFLALSTAQLEAFRNRHYGATGATLVVTGKFDARKIRLQIKKLFGSWPKGEGPIARTRVPDVAIRTEASRALVVDESLRHPEITLAFSASRGVLEKRAVRLIAEAIIESRMSAVREELGASYGVSVNYNFNEGPGSIIISGTINRDKSEAALKLMQGALSDLRSGRDLRADFIRARRKILKSYLGNTATATRVASRMTTLASYDLPDDFDERTASEIANASLEEVKTQLATDLAAENEVLIVRGAETLGRELFEALEIKGYELLK